MTHIPQKRYFKIGEVSKITGVKSYTIRYWEKEFPKLRPVRAGSNQRLYRKSHIELVLSIKDLIQQDGYTMAGAKKEIVNTHPPPTPAQPDTESVSPTNLVEPTDADTAYDDHPNLFAGVQASPAAANQIQSSQLQSAMTDVALVSIRDELKNILKILSV